MHPNHMTLKVNVVNWTAPKDMLFPWTPSHLCFYLPFLFFFLLKYLCFLFLELSPEILWWCMYNAEILMSKMDQEAYCQMSLIQYCDRGSVTNIGSTYLSSGMCTCVNCAGSLLPLPVTATSVMILPASCSTVVFLWLPRWSLQCGRCPSALTCSLTPASHQPHQRPHKDSAEWNSRRQRIPASEGYVGHFQTTNSKIRHFSSTMFPVLFLLLPLFVPVPPQTSCHALTHYPHYGF